MRLRSFFRAILAVLCFSPLVVMGAKPTFLVTLASAKPPATISAGETAHVSYRVTNNTPYALNSNGLSQIPPGLKQVGGINGCSSPFNLAVGGSCTLYLEIIADEMRGAIHGGPVVCNTLAHPIYCSKPSEGSELNIKNNSPPPPANQVTIDVTPSTLSFAVNSTDSVTITNQSTTMAAEDITATLPTGDTIRVTQNTCTPSLAAGQQCTITFTASGVETNAQVKIAGINTNTKIVSITTTVANISVDLSTAILDADGNTHTVFTITNNIHSAGAATNIQGTLPTSTSWSNVTVTPSPGCSSLAPGDSCTISMSSGTSTPTPTGTPNLAARLGIAGSNTNAVNPYVAFRYQGGLVFSIEENTPSPGNTTAGIAAEVNAGTNAWGGSGTLIGVTDNSTTPCNGSNDGACNTAVIVAALGTTPGSSAALLCANYEIDSAGNSPCVVGNTCYNDWYLPAFCQMFNIFGSGFLGCSGTQDTIDDNLFSLGYLSNLSALGFYWSSTETSSTTALGGNYASFSPIIDNPKNDVFGVSCARNSVS